MNNGNSFSHLGLQVGADWAVKCYAYSDNTPILNVEAGPLQVAISPARRNADQEAVQFARELVRQAERFAAEIERIHAMRASSKDKAAEDAAA